LRYRYALLGTGAYFSTFRFSASLSRLDVTVSRSLAHGALDRFGVALGAGLC
jgi:hypothetical protein